MPSVKHVSKGYCVQCKKMVAIHNGKSKKLKNGATMLMGTDDHGHKVCAIQKK